MLDVVLGSLQPNQPGVSQVVLLLADEDVDVGRERVVVIVGTGAAVLEELELVVVVVVVGSLQPNHPGVLHVDVDVAVVEEDVVVVVISVVVVLSRQPHQPGVLQVSVRVRVRVLVLERVVVVVSVPLLSKNDQLKQSWQSISSSHLGTTSYFS